MYMHIVLSVNTNIISNLIQTKDGRHQSESIHLTHSIHSI